MLVWNSTKKNVIRFFYRYCFRVFCGMSSTFQKLAISITSSVYKKYHNNLRGGQMFEFQILVRSLKHLIEIPKGNINCNMRNENVIVFPFRNANMYWPFTHIININCKMHFYQVKRGKLLIK